MRYGPCSPERSVDVESIDSDGSVFFFRPA